MNPEIEAYHRDRPSEPAREICAALATLIERGLPGAEGRIWHRHPVWFLDQNPTVGYSELKAGIRLMFWSGASFNEEALKPGTGKFKDASIVYTQPSQIHDRDVLRWLELATRIQWDYRNVAKRKGQLVRLR